MTEEIEAREEKKVEMKARKYNRKMKVRIGVILFFLNDNHLCIDISTLVQPLATRDVE